MDPKLWKRLQVDGADDEEQEDEEEEVDPEAKRSRVASSQEQSQNSAPIGRNNVSQVATSLPSNPLSTSSSSSSDELGSDLDDPTDSVNEMDGDAIRDLILCQYEKVHRVRARWRCILRAGIVHLGRRDYCFSKANTDFDW